MPMPSPADRPELYEDPPGHELGNWTFDFEGEGSPGNHVGPMLARLDWLVEYMNEYAPPAIWDREAVVEHLVKLAFFFCTISPNGPSPFLSTHSPVVPR